MKRILLAFNLCIVLFAITACGTTTTTDVLTKATTAQASTNVPTTTTTTATTQSLSLSAEPVTLTVWHAFTSAKATLLARMADEFETAFPNVTIELVAKASYRSIRSDVVQTLSHGYAVPDILFGNPTDFTHYDYLSASFLASLSDYADSTLQYVVADVDSPLYGTTIPMTLNAADYLSAALEQAVHPVSGMLLSLPIIASAETVVVNRTALSYHAAALRVSGLEVTDGGFLDTTSPLSHADLDLLGQVLISTMTDLNGFPVSDPGDYACTYLLSVDDTPGLFATLSRQWNAPYASALGQPEFDNETTRGMLNYLDQMFLSRTLVFPAEWESYYASDAFKKGDVCLAAIESTDYRYVVPAAADDPSTRPFGIFDVDFIPSVQLVETDDASYSADLGDEQVIVQASLAAQLKTINAGIAGASSDLEKTYAWLFLRQLTSTDASAEWAAAYGYLPVRMSGFASTRPITFASGLTISFADIVEIGNACRAHDGVLDWDQEDVRRAMIPVGLLASAMAQSQTYIRAIRPLGMVTDGQAVEEAIAKVRDFMEDLYLEQASPYAALTALSDDLSWRFR